MLLKFKYALFWMVCSFYLLLHLVRTCEDNAHSVPVGGLQPWREKKPRISVTQSSLLAAILQIKVCTNNLLFCTWAQIPLSLHCWQLECCLVARFITLPQMKIVHRNPELPLIPWKHLTSSVIDGTIQVSAYSSIRKFRAKKGKRIFFKKGLNTFAMGHPFKGHLSPPFPVSLSSCPLQQSWSLAPAGGVKVFLRLRDCSRQRLDPNQCPGLDGQHCTQPGATGPSAHCRCGSLQTQETELACSRGHQHLYYKFNLSWKTILLIVKELKLN